MTLNLAKEKNKQLKKGVERECVIKELEKHTIGEREDLIKFMSYIFKHEKKKDFFPEKFHYLIADKLKGVLSGKIKRLMINIPPRHGKSELITKCFPIWALGNNPNVEFIATSYSATLAQSFSSEARDYYTSNSFGKVFPRADKLHETQNTKDHWKVTSGGKYYSTGSGGSITGVGASCIVGETLIQTEEGEISIEKLAINDKKIRVKSYNHISNKIEYNNILAYQISNNDKIYEITTSTGNKIRATGEHKFFVLGQGYKEAKDLGKKDIIIYSQESLYGMLKRKMMKMINLQKMFLSGLYGEILKKVGKLLMNKRQKNKQILFGGMQNKISIQMYSLFIGLQITNTSQRQKSTEQGIGKLNNSMCKLSCYTSFIKKDTISDIRIIDGITKVYDIEVENNNNFFANNILVHNCFIIDDPLKPDEVDSDLKRIGINNWYENTVTSRLNNPKTDTIIIIMQRLHDNDLCGYLQERMNEGTGEDWDIVSLPAIIEEDKTFILSTGKEITFNEGEPLFPHKFTIPILDEIKKINPQVFSCQWIQDPISKDTQEFHQEWFKYYDDIPNKQGRIFTTVDPAFSKKKTADESAITTVKFIDDNIYILEQTVGRYDPAELEDKMIYHIRKWEPEVIGVESIAAQVTITFSLRRRILKEQLYKTQIEEIRQRQDKNAKIRALVPLYRNGLIYHKRNDSLALETQLLKFPRGRHDDMIDCLQLVLYLYELQPNTHKIYKIPKIKFNKFGMPVII